MKKISVIICLIIALFGCNSYKNIAYLQSAGEDVVYNDTLKSGVPDPKLKIGDILIVTVNSNTPEAAMPFNLPLIPGGDGLNSYNNVGSTSTMSSGFGLQNYLIDVNGSINFPIVGEIKALGMTKTELSEYIKSKIFPYYIKEEPIISIRYANYKISILGEVFRPNVYNVQNEKINIFEAIALAGDLTIYGQRENVLLIRENDLGKRETLRIDLRDERLVNSPYFYLQQNDILYIQPNKPKSRSSKFSTAETITISVVGTLISLTSLIVNLTR